MTNTNQAAIENLRNFALEICTGAHPHDHADRPQFSAFVHMCDAALAGEEWAIDRVTAVLNSAAPSLDQYLGVIRATDTTRPDGSIARSFEV